MKTLKQELEKSQQEFNGFLDGIRFAREDGELEPFPKKLLPDESIDYDGDRITKREED